MRSCATESRLKRLLHILSLWPQVWRPAGCQGGLDPLQMRLYADPELFLLGDTNFATFRLSSCKTTQFGHQGMPGRVLKSGCVQVVQNLRIIPDVLHPRSRLSEPVADHVGEIVYIPVFDTLHPHIGPVAVLEALLSARATDSMLVANFISLAGTVLSSLQVRTTTTTTILYCWQRPTCLQHSVTATVEWICRAGLAQCSIAFLSN
eukprot:GHRR01017570.1.p1 GENE.GHRR01017570.1~~GHRR01017570.1.p1  ORF type:complete len:206 (+),score=32.77 GHRR01017570.1:550-1167(+)